MKNVEIYMGDIKIVGYSDTESSCIIGECLTTTPFMVGHRIEILGGMYMRMKIIENTLSVFEDMLTYMEEVLV